MINMLEKVTLPPCRLFYSEEAGIPLDWQGTVGEMKRVIQNETKLSIDNDRVHFIFKGSPAEELFDEEFSILAIEVIGPIANFEPEYFYHDRGETQVHKLELTDDNLSPVALKQAALTIFGGDLPPGRSDAFTEWEIVLDLNDDKVSSSINFF